MAGVDLALAAEGKPTFGRPLDPAQTPGIFL
jgi:hypothetical protein